MKWFSYFFTFFTLCSHCVAISQECTDVPIQLQLNSGDWAEEITWSITDASGLLVDSSDTDYQNNLEYFYDLCLQANTCFQFNLYDSYGDGWNGASYSLQYADSVSLVSGTLAPSLYNDSAIFCVNDGSLCEGNVLSLTIETGIWAEEISWSITDTLGSYVDTSTVIYSDSSNYNSQLCVASGCYYFNMYDSYGDGWQGANFQISLNENTIASGQLENGSNGQIAFSLNSDCNFEVCTDESAINYNQVDGNGASCIYSSEHVNLLYNWADTNLELNGLGGSYSEVYGYASQNREYAILGSTYGTHIIDVTDPLNSVEVTRVQGAFSSSGVTHRDFHTMGKYLYAVCDQGESTLQIIDLSNLPESVDVVYDSDELFSRSHNIFIDTLVKKMYSCSTEGFDDSGAYWTSSLCVYDLSNPVAPSLLYNMDEYIPNTHDLWVTNDTAFINCPGTGTLVWEFAGSPSQISTFTSYPDFGTNHSGWKYGDTYIFAEENSGYDLKIVDASDVSNLELLSTFNSEVNEYSIAHNLMIKDDLVYISYYHDGLQVFDVSEPENPVKVAFYDTYMTENTGGYAGAWGVYSFLPSGNILISDVQSGLFVLEMNFVQEQEIDLHEGWNMVSTYMDASDLTAEMFVEAIVDDVIIMKDNIGSAYLPDWNFDGIGLLNHGEAYQIKTLIEQNIIVNGEFVSTTNIDLTTGWNMIGVLSQDPQSIEEVLSSCTDLVVIAKDSFGVAYLPQWSFNGIGDMLPGQGYQIKMLSEAQINFEE